MKKIQEKRKNFWVKSLDMNKNLNIYRPDNDGSEPVVADQRLTHIKCLGNWTDGTFVAYVIIGLITDVIAHLVGVRKIMSFLTIFLPRNEGTICIRSKSILPFV